MEIDSDDDGFGWRFIKLGGEEEGGGIKGYDGGYSG